jgi:hypothetical protein
MTTQERKVVVKSDCVNDSIGPTPLFRQRGHRYFKYWEFWLKRTIEYGDFGQKFKIFISIGDEKNLFSFANALTDFETLGRFHHRT